jgi:eukaryotic-like serine/threonine-protein kinase
MLHQVGDIINNRYAIEKIIAQGGMGAIYLALDESLNVRVAVKENLFPSEESTRQFRREATILAGLRHPNLPRVTDHFIIIDQGQYLVMDYIEGEDLKERLEKQGKLTEKEAITIGAKVCDALIFLHSRQPEIIHRDIKPGNIKITPEGEVYLVDFGLAKQIQPGQVTTTGAQALTPGYAPPEQYAQGTDPRSDIYGLAATLYTALCKSIPEEGMARLLGNATLTPVRTQNPEISEQTANVIEKALSVKREDRYQTAAEFKQALTGSRPVEPIKTISTSDKTVINPNLRIPTSALKQSADQTILPENAVTITGKLPLSGPIPAQKKSGFPILPVLLGGGILLIIIILGAAFLVGHYFAARSNKTALPPTLAAQAPAAIPTVIPTAASTLIPAATGTPSIAVTAAAQLPLPILTKTLASPLSSPTPAVTPLGGNQQIAYVSVQGGLPQIWLMNNDGSNPKQISNLPDGACQPDWSPDGNRLVFTSPCKARQEQYKGSSLFLMNADGSNVFPLSSVPGGDYEPAWSPDGSKIVFTSLRDAKVNLYLYTLSNNSVARLTNTLANDRRATWSPDGKWIAFERYKTNVPDIWIMAADGSAQTMFSSENNASIMPAWSPKGDVILFSQGSSLPWLAARQFNVKGAPEAQISALRPAYEADYSSDGFWLVLDSVNNGNRDIMRMRSNGSNLTQLTKENGDDFNPKWRPLPLK